MHQIRLLGPIASRHFLLSSTTLLRLLAVGLAIGCADRGPPTDETSRRKPVLVGSRVVRAPDNPRFHADTQLTFQGRRLNEGCVFERAVTMGLGEHVVERVAEYDLETCLYVVERGSYDHPSGAPPHRHGDTSSTTKVHLGAPRPSSSVSGGPTPPMFSSTTLTSSCARQHLWFQEPLGIDVSNSELHVIWEWDGELVWNSWAELASLAYEPSGWRVMYHDLHSDYLSNGTGVTTNGYSEMENGSFPCPSPSATWTYYWPNSITQWGYGQVTFYHSAYASGGCSNFLTLYTEQWTEY
jgi:hypothetical protein